MYVAECDLTGRKYFQVGHPIVMKVYRSKCSGRQ